MVAPNPKRTKVFISYSHQDSDWLKRLRVHLRPLERERGLDVWDDTRIQSGSKWRDEIKKAVQSARVALLLVSADFLASDFIEANELPPLLAAAEQEGATILSLILSPCRFEQTKGLSEFQSVNPPSRPLTAMNKHEQEEFFVKVVGDVERSLGPQEPTDVQTPARPSRSRSLTDMIGVAKDHVAFEYNPLIPYEWRLDRIEETASGTLKYEPSTADDMCVPLGEEVLTPKRIGIGASLWRCRDWELRRGLADGILTRDGLQQYIKKQVAERAELYARHGAGSHELSMFDHGLRESRLMLQAMEDPVMNARAVDYLPEQLKGFPVSLRALATELLQLDDKDGVSEICQKVIDDARSRYYAMPGRSESEKEHKNSKLAQIDELARKLRLY